MKKPFTLSGVTLLKFGLISNKLKSLVFVLDNCLIDLPFGCTHKKKTFADEANNGN